MQGKHAKTHSNHVLLPDELGGGHGIVASSLEYKDMLYYVVVAS